MELNFEKTYEELLQEKLDLVDVKFDKRNSGVLYNAMAPNAAETRAMLIFLQWVMDNVFGDTAEKEYLERIALCTKGLVPDTATKAICKLETDAQVDIGARFTVDSIIYTVTEELPTETYYCYKAECFTEGIEGNQHFGTAIPVEYIQGLTHAELTEILIPGEEEEDTETFRKRWLSSFNNVAFGGNKADYKAKVNALDGVGDCKVYRAESATGEQQGGNVRIVVINSEFEVPSDTLIEQIQEAIDPSQDGEGTGIAPIGHIVNVTGVTGLAIDIETNIVCDTGYAFEDIKSNIETKIKEYMLSLAKTWANNENLVVRKSQIEAIILSVPYVLDVTDTTLNGSEENIILAQNTIPVLGVITNAA